MSTSHRRLTLTRARDFVIRHRIILLSLVVVLVFGLFVSQNIGEFSQISTTLQEADLTWTGLALTLNLAVISAAGLSYKVVLGKLGHNQPWAWLANLHLRRHMVGTVTPMGGPVSVYVFVKSLGSRGVGTEDALFAAAIRGLVGYGAFVLVLIPVLFLGNPSTIIVLGATLLLLVLILLVTAVTVVLRQSWNPHWLLSRLPDRVASLVTQARTHQLRPQDLTQPFGLAVAHHALGVGTLYLCLLAVGYRGGIEVALVGYAIGSLVMMLAPLFQGVGVVEVTMTVTLQQLGVPVPAAIAATILFRFADIWFPFLLGVVSHASTNEPVRRAGARMPALVAAGIGLTVLLTPLDPQRFAAYLAVPATLIPAMAILCSASLLAVSHAMWTRRPVTPVLALGALATSSPLLLIQAGSVLGVPMTLLQLVITATIG